MKLIIKGDDLGWTDGINAGIEKAARDGILTATGCMPNMAAAKRGIDMIKKYPHVSIGQHTNVVIGKPVSNPEDIPHLVDENGNFHSSRYYRELQKDGNEIMGYFDELYSEIEAQLLRFMEMAEQKPAYMEGHAVISDEFKKALRAVAEKYDILCVGEEPGEYNEEYGIYFPPAPQYVYDALSNMDFNAQFGCDAKGFIIRDESHILDREKAALFFHPGFVDKDIVKMSSFQGIRAADCEALCDEEVKQWVKDNNVELINYNDLRREKDEI